MKFIYLRLDHRYLIINLDKTLPIQYLRNFEANGQAFRGQRRPGPFTKLLSLPGTPIDGTCHVTDVVVETPTSP